VADLDKLHHLRDPRGPDLGAALSGVDPAQPAFPVEGRERLERRLRLRPTGPCPCDVCGELFLLRTLRLYRDAHRLSVLQTRRTRRLRPQHNLPDTLVHQAGTESESFDRAGVPKPRQGRREVEW
jgi:hypothetical protein